MTQTLSPVASSLASRPTEIDIGTVVARIFDLLEGTRLEPYAASVAWGLVNAACRRPER